MKPISDERSGFLVLKKIVGSCEKGVRKAVVTNLKNDNSQSYQRWQHII